MPFSPISVNTKTYNQAGDGRYMESTVSFGSPTNYFKVAPGSANSKTGLTSAAVSRVFQKDVTVGSATNRVTATVQLNMQVPSGITATEVDGLVSDISEFLTASILNRILNGEQ